MRRAEPVRTCVGCRERAPKSETLRVIASVDGAFRRVVPDEHGGTPGRGAHVHPALACLDLAERRRVFPRALRIQGPLDAGAVRDWITAHRPVPPGADRTHE